MASVPVINTALYEQIFSVNGQVVENTMWFEHIDSIAVADLEQLVDIMEAWAKDVYVPLTSTSCSLIKVKATDMTTSISPMFERAVLSDNVGESGSSVADNSASFTIKFTTAQRGRAYRGRNFFPGIPRDMAVANYVPIEYATQILGAYEGIPTVLGVSGWTHVVVSRYNGKDPETGKPMPRVTGVTTPVTGYAYTNLRLDHQRRRLPGEGE